MSRAPAKLHPTIGIGVAARQFGRSYRSTLRLLTRLAQQDLAARMPEADCWWIGFFEPGAPKLVNLSRLRVAHPALFERRWVSREEYDDLTEQVREVKADLHALRQRYRALAARSPKEGRTE